MNPDKDVQVEGIIGVDDPPHYPHWGHPMLPIIVRMCKECRYRGLKVHNTDVLAHLGETLYCRKFGLHPEYIVGILYDKERKKWVYEEICYRFTGK